MDSYTPTNSPASCPTGDGWAAAATPLPPTPNAQLCQCMTDTLGCVVNPSTNSDNYGQLFNYVCGHDSKACDGIAHNATLGDYGAYGMCSPSEQLSFVFNAYYKAQGSASDACSFKGAAQTQQASSASGACQSLINQAGTAGTGTVTSAPTGSAGSSASSSGSAGFRTTPTTETGLMPAMFIMVVALLSGMGMIAL
jgi:1,3-beta-glucanosyltransferase GAS1